MDSPMGWLYQIACTRFFCHHASSSTNFDCLALGCLGKYAAESAVTRLLQDGNNWFRFSTIAHQTWCIHESASDIPEEDLQNRFSVIPCCSQRYILLFVAQQPGNFSQGIFEIPCWMVPFSPGRSASRYKRLLCSLAVKGPVINIHSPMSCRMPWI